MMSPSADTKEPVQPFTLQIPSTTLTLSALKSSSEAIFSPFDSSFNRDSSLTGYIPSSEKACEQTAMQRETGIHRKYRFIMDWQKSVKAGLIKQ
jgi:hypothetical protein